MGINSDRPFIYIAPQAPGGYKFLHNRPHKFCSSRLIKSLIRSFSYFKSILRSSKVLLKEEGWTEILSVIPHSDLINVSVLTIFENIQIINMFLDKFCLISKNTNWIWMMNFSVTRQSCNYLLRNLSIVYFLSFVFKSLLLLFRLKFITVYCFKFSWTFLVQLTYYWIRFFIT